VESGFTRRGGRAGRGGSYPLLRRAKRVTPNDSLAYVGLAQVYHTDIGEAVVDVAEVFSLIRESELGSDAYIDHFFDTGRENQGAIE
jgi:hypothetical protein